MTEVYKGYFKLVEECGELIAELGKLGPFPTGRHPDGQGVVIDRILKEIADVFAASDYFIHINNLLNENSVVTLPLFDRRVKRKRNLFMEWDLRGIDDGKEKGNETPAKDTEETQSSFRF